MPISLSVTTSAIADTQGIDAADVTVPVGQLKTHLENVLNGAQDGEAIRFAELGSNPSTPATGKWKIYFKSTGMYIIDDTGAVIGPLGTGGGGGVTDHGALTGLADDDHTQYLLINGTRAMSGTLDLANQYINRASRVVMQVRASAPATPSAGYGVLYTDVDEKLYYMDDGGTAYDLLSASAGDYIHIEDQKASGTNGGSFTASAWQTRTLNTEVTDTGGHASLASNQITLAAGTYRAVIKAPAWSVNFHKARLQNVTDGTTLLSGSTEDANISSPHITSSWIVGQFTLAASKVLEVQHYCSSTKATTGFGAAASFGVNEVYTVVTLTKVA